MTADSVLSKYRAAIGGDGAIGELKSIHLSGTLTDGARPSRTVDVYQASPNKFLVESKDDRGSQRQAYNGSDTWVTMAQGARKMDDVHARMIKRVGRFFRDATSIPTFSDAVVGTADVDGKTVTAVRGTVAASNETDILYFDPQTGLLDRVAYYTKTILGDLPEVYVYSDYRKVGGVLVPFKIVHQTVSGLSTQQFTSAEPNVKVTDEQFDMPKQ